MCGICGFYSSEPTNERVIQNMTSSLAHRGPDDEGYYSKGPIHLGHRRLSIIDLQGSRQPLFNEDRSIALVCNGEIYNFKTLRDELLRSGHTFNTDGDSEVLIHAYEEFGVKMLDRLSGMFSFAIWDDAKALLFIARDQMGIKPLYYMDNGRIFVFGSELKAILQHPGVSREIDLEAVNLFLESQFIPSPLSIYKSIKKLPAAHYLIFKNKQLTLHSYWRAGHCPKYEWTEEEALDRLDVELKRSVKSMLVSDVPLGAFISGGIDSGLIAAVMTDCLQKPVETFNLGFNETHGAKSEHLEAEAVSAHIGSRHHTIMVDPGTLLDSLDSWMDIMDEPFADTAAIPVMLLSKQTRKHVAVVLTGEGADEIFSGYGNYRKRLRDETRLAAWSKPWSPLPGVIRRLPSRWRKDRHLWALSQPKSRRYVTIPSLFHQAIKPSMFSKMFLSKIRLQMSDFSAFFYDECDSPYYLDHLMYVDSKLWLPDDLLTKVDCATMAHSLEARVPYLDHGFVDFVSKLHPDLKQNGNTTKYILKRLAERYLPRDIVYRPKQGFIMPVKEWLMHDLADRLTQCLAPEQIRRRNLFQEKPVVRLIDEHMSGRKNHSFRLWGLLILELWLQRHEPNFSV
ncbi:MAG: asparagine synthase (glutamine-hydrolyzing) [Proteobacteria bacterium]|nr:asparagine synthase (glutamine-hydrolyzing) [Pseudomonadota bacterium]MBU1451163.1 asparagine synthase (glutamine-hydrolyzing) [Pseudomonadota bacterium]MBU2469471.1 asparagine synthase (glutamine-hydrolyzing) [Pseudomonadota bacterium]